MIAWGPFGTEQEASDLPAVREIYEKGAGSGHRGAMDEGVHRMLRAALAGSGVELGAYDWKIAAWLANWEPQVVAVVAGWVMRAHEAGRAGEGGAGDG